ncbi:MAG: hypothetical protein FWB78_06660 [Treponema sp.]|nr:hypothetical protein [Treponema sp.]
MRERNRMGIFAILLIFGMTVIGNAGAETFHMVVSEHALAPGHFRHVRDAVRNAPAGTLEGVGTAEIFGGNVSTARAVAYARAVVDISRQLGPFGMDVLNGGMIRDIVEFAEGDAGTYAHSLQAPFDAVLASSFIVEEGFNGRWSYSYRLVARLAYGDLRFLPVTGTLTQPHVDSYVPEFVLNARRYSPGSAVVGVGVARMATVNKSRLIAHVRAILDIYHQTDGIIQTASANLYRDGFYIFESSTTSSIFTIGHRDIRIIDDGMTTTGDYWVVVGFTDDNNFRPTVPARSAQALGGSAGGIPEFVTNFRTNNDYGHFLVGIGVAREATISMSRTVARTRAMADISMQMWSLVENEIRFSSEWELEEHIARASSEMHFGSFRSNIFIVGEDFIDGNYWVAVGFSSDRGISRPIASARLMQITGNTWDDIQIFAANTRMSLFERADILVGIGVASKASLSMSRIAARTWAMAEVFMQVRSFDEDSVESHHLLHSMDSGFFIVDEDFIGGYYVVVLALPMINVMIRGDADLDLSPEILDLSPEIIERMERALRYLSEQD